MILGAAHRVPMLFLHMKAQAQTLSADPTSVEVLYSVTPCFYRLFSFYAETSMHLEVKIIMFFSC